MSDNIPKRKAVLLEAAETITQDRVDKHGEPEDSFEAIAQFWTTYLKSKGVMLRNCELTKADASCMLALFKVARHTVQENSDNLVDCAGYIGITAELTDKE